MPHPWRKTDNVKVKDLAFAKWLKQESHGSLTYATNIFREEAVKQGPRGVCMDIMRKTGDERYSHKTFEKAAALCLGLKDERPEEYNNDDQC